MQSEDVQGAGQRYFVINQGGRYYVALAVAEYDPADAPKGSEKEKGVAEVKKLFDDAKASGGTATESTSAVSISGTIPPSIGCMNTGL